MNKAIILIVFLQITFQRMVKITAATIQFGQVDTQNDTFKPILLFNGTYKLTAKDSPRPFVETNQYDIYVPVKLGNKVQYCINLGGV